jgi:hypothetical protein
MLEKVKNYVLGGLSFLALLLGALLFRSSRRNGQLESEVATEKANAVVKENDHERQIAKEHADRLVIDYESAKREYDESKLGGAGKL